MSCFSGHHSSREAGVIKHLTFIFWWLLNIITYKRFRTYIDGTPCALKGACTVWIGGKSGDDFKGLPIDIVSGGDHPGPQRSADVDDPQPSLYCRDQGKNLCLFSRSARHLPCHGSQPDRTKTLFRSSGQDL